MPDWPVPQAILDKLSQRLLDATNAAYFTPVEQPQWAGANIIPIFEQGYYLRYDRLFEAWGMNRNGVQVRNPGASGVFYAIAHDSVTTLATVYVKNMVAAGPDKSRRALAAGVLATAAKQHVEVDALIY